MATGSVGFTTISSCSPGVPVWISTRDRRGASAVIVFDAVRWSNRIFGLRGGASASRWAAAV